MKSAYTQFHDNRYAEIPQETKDKAKEIILYFLGDIGVTVVRDAYAKHGWYWIHGDSRMGHFRFGMEIRNALRMNGVTDEQFKSGNLDDYYVQLVEYATGLRE